MASRTQSIPSRPLDFNKAMTNFKVMFPTVDYEVIEMVLRANNGLVAATVDQLLAMMAESSEPEENGLLDPELNVRLPSYSDTGASNFEPPPAYTPRVEEDPNFSYDSTFLQPHLGSFSTPVPSQNTPPSTKDTHSEWQPPMLGTLPRDFLRISLDDRPSYREGISSENPLYDVSSVQESPPRTGNRVEAYRTSQKEVRVVRPNPNAATSRTGAHGFDRELFSIPITDEEAKHAGKKGKSKKFGQISRKFKRKKTKSTKGTTYQQISGTNLLDEDSGD